MSQKIYDFHLTELILSLHNEVQSAVDYISEVAQKEGTELGKSTALLGVENLRIRLPFEISFDQKTGNFPAPIRTDRSASVKSNLAARKGFAIDIGEKDKRALLTKVKVLTAAPGVASAAAADATPGAVQSGLAELEITFSPYKRD